MKKEKRKRDHQSVTVFDRDKEFEIWSTCFTGREIVAQTNRNKGFFEFIARQVIGLHRAEHFLSPFFSRNLILEISSRPALNENSSMTLRRVLPALLRLHAPVVSCKSTEQ